MTEEVRAHFVSALVGLLVVRDATDDLLRIVGEADRAGARLAARSLVEELLILGQQAQTGDEEGEEGVDLLGRVQVVTHDVEAAGAVEGDGDELWRLLTRCKLLDGEVRLREIDCGDTAALARDLADGRGCRGVGRERLGRRGLRRAARRIRRSRRRGVCGRGRGRARQDSADHQAERGSQGEQEWDEHAGTHADLQGLSVGGADLPILTHDGH